MMSIGAFLNIKTILFGMHVSILMVIYIWNRIIMKLIVTESDISKINKK